jgi:tyrosinase
LIKSIAELFPEGDVRDRYVSAAAKFRIPYWDWAVVPAAGQSVLPASVQSPNITVEGPNGSQDISNPLFSYIFNPLNPSELPDQPVSVDLIILGTGYSKLLDDIRTTLTCYSSTHIFRL